MRMILRKVILAADFPLRKHAVRYASTDARSPDKKQETEKVKIKKRANIMFEKFGPVTALNIDRLPKRNSLDVDTLLEMQNGIKAFDKDEEAKVLVLNGEGGTFCSGFDMNEIANKGYNNVRDASMYLLRRPLCDKITIAAVTGYAVAEGFELALACDLRVIDDTAIMGCLGRRFGFPQSLFGARRLTSLIGLSPALDLLITGRLITGVDANRLGLACILTSTGTAFSESLKLAKSLIKFPQSALMMDKLAAINSQLNPESKESMRDEIIIRTLFGNAMQDMNEGVKMFQEGIGRHGKFCTLKEVPLKDWELEETVLEVTIIDTPKPTCP